MKYNSKTILFITSLLISMIGYAQVQEVWAVPYSYNSTSRDFARAIAVDADGNIYVAGAIHRTDEDYGDYIAVIKYNKTGTQLWVRTYGSGTINGGLKPVAMVLDAAANVYVTGSSDFGGNVFTTLKYNKDGQFRWAQRFGGLTDYHHGDAAGIAVDPAGNVFVTGFVYTAPFNTPDFYFFNVFVTVKYDNLGEQEWVRSYNGTAPGNGINQASAITVDGSGNAYVTGKSQLDGQMDYVTMKYSPTGSQLWAARYQGPANQDDEANAIVLDGAYNVYVTGKSNSNNQADYLTVKYDNNGNELWTTRYDGGSGDVARAICMNQDGNICVTGRSGASGQSGNYGTVIYNGNGVQQWVRHFNNTGSSDEEATDIATDGDANIYVCGTSNSLIATVKYNSTGTLQWSKTNGPLEPSFGFGSDIKKMSVVVDLTGNVYVAGEHDPPPVSDRGDFITIRYAQCTLVCPANITVNNDPGKCGAVVNFNPATYTGDCGSSFTYSHDTGIEFPIGTTTVTATSDATGATCSFSITVNDNQNPVMTCPEDKTVNMGNNVCYVLASTVNAVEPTATDNCSATVEGVRSDGQPLAANYPGGITTITWTATDPSNNKIICTQKITVTDNQPPVITGASVSKAVLSPPNHKMVDVTVDYTVTDNCAATTTISITSDEAQTGLSNGDVGPDIVKINEHLVQLRAERDGKGDGRVYTITITAIDGSGNISTVTKTVIVAHNIGSPHSGAAVKVGSTVNFSGSFWDVAGNKHSAKWLIDDKTTVSGVITEPSGMKNGTVTGSYKFTLPGVYKLKMNISDQKGITTSTTTNGDLEAIVVVYDPNGGYTYGGGYFTSPAGSLKSDPTVTGDVSYGFTMNYYKNATLPKGETQFEFKIGDFEFNAVNFDYLSINKAKAQFKGTGKIIGGQSGINFIMTVIDGDLDGSGVDKVRMKIYNKNTGQVFYDNQPGASDAADPTTAVGSNSVIVIQSTNPTTSVSARISTSAKEEMESSKDLAVTASPNPSTNHFKLMVTSNYLKDKIAMQVTDMYGRIIEVRNILAGQTIQLGDRYRPGTYIVKLIQRDMHRQLKLVKLTE